MHWLRKEGALRRRQHASAAELLRPYDLDLPHHVEWPHGTKGG